MNFHARHYRTLRPVKVSVENGIFRSIDDIVDGDDLPFIAPGLFDLQINGINGTWFSDENLTVDQCLEALQAHYQYGITHLFPTLITNSFEALQNGFSVIRQACEQHSWANRMVLGCHLEGPYIAIEDGPRGAHPLDQVRPCDWKELQRLLVLDRQRRRIHLGRTGAKAKTAAEVREQRVQIKMLSFMGKEWIWQPCQKRPCSIRMTQLLSKVIISATEKPWPLNKLVQRK